VPYLSASEVVIHEEALYQVYVLLTLPLEALRNAFYKSTIITTTTAIYGAEQ